MANSFQNGFLRDATGILQTNTTATSPTWHDGFMRNSDGSLLVIQNTAAISPVTINGFARDASSNYALIVNPSATTPTWQNGFLRGSSPGALSVHTSPTGAVSFQNGFLRDSSGFLMVSNGGTVIPATFVQDSFTDVAGTALTAHTGEVGATWTNHPNFTSGTSVIGTNDDYTSSSASTFMLASGVGASPTYTVACTINFLTKITGQVAGIFCRCDPTQTTMYEMEYSVTAAQWQLILRNNGAVTSLGTYNFTVNNGDSIPITLQIQIPEPGTNYVTATVEGTQIFQVADSTIGPVAGRCGMRSGGAAATSTTGMHFDNFTATNS